MSVQGDSAPANTLTPGELDELRSSFRSLHRRFWLGIFTATLWILCLYIKDTSYPRHFWVVFVHLTPIVCVFIMCVIWAGNGDESVLLRRCAKERVWRKCAEGMTAHAGLILLTPFLMFGLMSTSFTRPYVVLMIPVAILSGVFFRIRLAHMVGLLGERLLDNRLIGISRKIRIWLIVSSVVAVTALSWMLVRSDSPREVSHAFWSSIKITLPAYLIYIVQSMRMYRHVCTLLSRAARFPHRPPKQ